MILWNIYFDVKSNSKITNSFRNPEFGDTFLTDLICLRAWVSLMSLCCICKKNMLWHSNLVATGNSLRRPWRWWRTCWCPPSSWPGPGCPAPHSLRSWSSSRSPGDWRKNIKQFSQLLPWLSNLPWRGVQFPVSLCPPARGQDTWCWPPSVQPRPPQLTSPPPALG